ncbi:hypothetical protein CLU79DRAFT_752849 [Phycomyces nitens]|nr:hypothetical protein CLU79DRAFT_752841 [Phycomyces nitens]KAI9021698.1 hypothetical protein CLU79DRAFT_752847 [Phycomyces nitens]KAI9021699.1 hypothetical protein CLU79DRAFT_752848 [Phycomyces nitens]KAI9021700.1 hypothetical protein CLU79DRAFT_752849 [Phycomyces nitens]
MLKNMVILSSKFQSLFTMVSFVSKALVVLSLALVVCSVQARPFAPKEYFDESDRYTYPEHRKPTNFAKDMVFPTR